MEQHVVAVLQPLDGQRLLEQVLRGQALEHHGRPGLEADRVRQHAHALGRHHAHLAVAARRLAGVGGTVADLEVGHAFAHRLHDAGAFHAKLQRHGEGVEPAALVDIDEVQADGLVADADLARAGVAHGHIYEFELFGATGLVDLDGKGHGGSPGTKWNKCNRQSCHVSVALAVMLPWRTGYSG
jgi:hypothetical protein